VSSATQTKRKGRGGGGERRRRAAAAQSVPPRTGGERKKTRKREEEGEGGDAGRLFSLSDFAREEGRKKRGKKMEKEKKNDRSLPFLARK